jgi:hypothetical protein
MRERYFVRLLNDADFRPSPEAAYVIEFLRKGGPSMLFAYIGRESNTIVAMIHATKGRLPVQGHDIPDAVFEAARRLRGPGGEYVNEKGEAVQPSFIPE